MQKIETFLWITIISIIIYYVIPMVGFGMDDFFANIFAKICVLLINVIYSFYLGILLSKKNNFKWYYFSLVGILFVPSAFMIYDISTIYFSIIYIIICIMGSLIYNKKQV